MREIAGGLAEKAAPAIAKAKDAIKNSRIPEKARAFAEKHQIRSRLERLLPQDLAKSLPRTFDPAAIAAWLTQAFQKGGAGLYGTVFVMMLSTWFLADLSALLVERFIPEPPIARTANRFGQTKRARSLEEYSVIASRNLFSSQGLIAGEDQPSAPGQPVDLGGAPVRTSLPFNLVGTLILRDELRSIATIEDKTASLVYPVRVDDEIPGKVRILSVEARKVTFINVSSGRREYIDLPLDAGATSRVTVSSAPKSALGIEKLSPTQYNVSRTEVDNALKDLNKVLTQARAVPNFENGLPAGYKLFQIVPGSIYDKLGLQNGDVLCGLNGSPINDPGKAFEMLGELKNSNGLKLCVKRDGKQQENNYDIR